MVVLARFNHGSEAEMLANLLKSEGIDCYVRDGYIHQIYGDIDLGGVKVELLEKDLPRATEIMKDFGYLNNGESGKTSEVEEAEETEDIDEDEETEEAIKALEEYRADYERKKEKLSRTMTILTIIIILLVGCMILVNKYYNGT